MSTATFHCSRRFLLDIQNKTTTLKRVAIIWVASVWQLRVGWESKATSGHHHNPLSLNAAATANGQPQTQKNSRGTTQGTFKTDLFGSDKNHPQQRFLAPLLSHF